MNSRKFNPDSALEPATKFELWTVAQRLALMLSASRRFNMAMVSNNSADLSDAKKDLDRFSEEFEKFVEKLIYDDEAGNGPTT